MARGKKTRRGAEVRSIVGAKKLQRSIWWLAVLDKKMVHVFSFDFSSRRLSSVWHLEESDLHEVISRRLRCPAGRTQDSFSWSRGGHQTAHARHSFSARTSPKRRASEALLFQGAHFLKQESKKGAFDHLGLVASPAIYGLFKNFLGTAVAKKVALHAPALPNYLSARQKERKLLALLPVEPSQEPRLMPKPSGTHLEPNEKLERIAL